jgi:hypothetical protein
MDEHFSHTHTIPSIPQGSEFEMSLQKIKEEDKVLGFFSPYLESSQQSLAVNNIPPVSLVPPSIHCDIPFKTSLQCEAMEERKRANELEMKMKMNEKKSLV